MIGMALEKKIHYYHHHYYEIKLPTPAQADRMTHYAKLQVGADTDKWK